MDQSEGDQALEPIWQAIWARRPILGEIVQKHSDQCLLDYTQGFLDVNKTPSLDARKEEFFDIAHEMAVENFGPEVADGVIEQLRRLPLVSTTDHLAPIQHPFFLNCNIVSALPCIEAKEPVKYLVVLPFASTSLNNASAFARGIIFHGDKRGSHDFTRLSLYGDREKMAVTYNMRPFNQEDITKVLEQLAKKEREGEVTPERAEGIRTIFNEIFAADDVLKASDACVQMCKVSYKMWPRMFHPKDERVPDLIYLDIETLVREILLKYHLNNPNSLIHRVLFDRSIYPLVKKYFDGIPGAFSTEKGWGSYMFWALDDKNHRVGLNLDPDQERIASEYRTCVFDMNPESIEKALVERKIFPGMFLCYLVVALYYGFKCLGGFCQVSDLTRTKEAWQNMLHEMGEHDEAEAIAPIQTRELGGDGMVLAYFKTPNNDLVPATGIDLILEDHPTDFSRYLQLAREIRFKEIMAPLVPEIYKVLFTVDERIPEFLRFTPEEIMNFTGLQEKIRNLE